MNLDIFYNELKVVDIQQQEAFPFLSLIGEIGGFLGLQLGASILTLCEIIDFLITKCAATCSSKTKVVSFEKSVNPMSAQKVVTVHS